MGIVKARFILRCRVDEHHIRLGGNKVCIAVNTGDIIDIDEGFALSKPRYYQLIGKAHQVAGTTSAVECDPTRQSAVSMPTPDESAPASPEDGWPHPDDLDDWIGRSGFNHVRTAIKAELGFSAKSVDSLHRKYLRWYDGQ